MLMGSVSWAAVLVAGAVLLGCSGAEWRAVEIDSPYQAPKALTVTVVAPRVAQEASQALISALVDELRSSGISATIVSGTAGGAEANLTISKWEPGSQAMRWLVGFGAGEGEIVVTVDTATIGIAGTAHGWISGGFFGGDSNDSAIATGRLIGRTIITGRSETQPRQPKTPRSMASRVGAQ
jgi:hypothetical protein